MRPSNSHGLLLAALALFAIGFVLLALAQPALAAPARVGVATAMEKIRPGTPAPGAAQASLEAARNEFEAFQIVVAGGDGGVTGVQAEASLAPADVTLYRVGLYQVNVPSNTEGAVGLWPDPLIPAVDAYYGETRNAFPFDVPAGESRAIWVEIFVPPGTAPGTYSGSVVVSGAGLGTISVPVTLRVRDFELPSTATLKSAFGMGWVAACVAHRGSYEACGDAGVEAFHVLYARAALEHRISIETVVYDGPHDGDFTHFDQVYGPLLDGTAPGRLDGAKLTSIRITTNDPVEMVQWREHFAGRGWAEALFDYTCDEPPAGCSFGEIPGLAAPVHAAGIRTLITTDIDEILEYGLMDDIDIATPVVNFMHDKGGQDRRPEYEAFLAQSDAKELWWYQSCMSHGCGGGCGTTTDSYFTGWPSYMVDASAMQNRAMEWLSFLYDIEGELYFETVIHLVDAWEPDGQCDFNGQGDGTLFYPGTPGRIGGSTDIPVESIRLKLIREGMEDYEYFTLLAGLGDRALAEAEASAVFPAPYQAAAAASGALYGARSRVADRIEELGGGPPPVRPGLDVLRAGVEIAVDGDLVEFEDAVPQQVIAGAARATFRLLWDDDALYVAAEVTDPDLWVRGTGPDGELWDGDGIELLLDPGLERGGAPDAADRHVIVSAGGDLLDAAGAGATEDRSLTMGATHVVVVDGTLGGGAADGGYRVELRIPWAALGVAAPEAGVVLGGDLALNDATAAALASADWAGLTAFARPDRWNELRLSATLAGDPDPGPDPEPPAPTVGCGCHTTGSSSPAGSLLALTALVLAVRTRRRL